MPESTLIEISTGRVATVRLGANEDLIEGLERAAFELGFKRAFVRSGLGSLIEATLLSGAGDESHIAGPAIEVLSLSGELSPSGNTGSGTITLTGVLGDTRGMVWAGRLVRGRNPVCVTIEAVLEELLAAPSQT